MQHVGSSSPTRNQTWAPNAGGPRVLATGPLGKSHDNFICVFKGPFWLQCRKQTWKKEAKLEAGRTRQEASVVIWSQMPVDWKWTIRVGTEKSKLSNAQGTAAETWGPSGCQSKGERGPWDTSVTTMRNTNLSLGRKGLGI